MTLLIRITLLSLALVSGAQAATAIQSHDAILKVAKDYIMAHADAFPVTPKLEDTSLDSRLRLTKCDKPLQAFETQGGLKGGRTVVGIRCEGTKPWKIFVPIHVALPGKVVVAAEPVQRGQVVNKKALVIQERDLSKLHRGYLTDPAKIAGRRAKRSIRQGAIISPTALEQVNMVKRGSPVMILAASSVLQVRMKGKALANGAEGDRIKVKNLRSGRSVTATVVKPGLVQVVH